MKDNLIIITRIKKTILKLEKIIENFSRTENVLKDNIKITMYEFLKNAYKANISKDSTRLNYQKEMIVNIKMLDFYINCSYNKKMISPKQYNLMGQNFLEIFSMIQAWVKSEKTK
ncbi:MAG: four helix bundle protein [Bacilli bacterium]|nr:four helix bundle protein [Bacilli bacterium]